MTDLIARPTSIFRKPPRISTPGGCSVVFAMIAPVAALILSLPVSASAAETCARLKDLRGSSCEELAFDVDLSTCASRKVIRVAKTCSGDQAEIRAFASNATYIFTLAVGGESWGRNSWVISDVHKGPAQAAVPTLNAAPAESPAAERAKISVTVTPVTAARIENAAKPEAAPAPQSVSRLAPVVGSPSVTTTSTGATKTTETTAHDVPVAREHVVKKEVEEEKVDVREKRFEGAPEHIMGYPTEEKDEGGEAANAQVAGVDVAGYLDMYAQSNFVTHSPTSGGRYFGTRNGVMQINSAELNLEHKHGEVTFHLDIGAGENENAMVGYIYQPGTEPTPDSANEITKYIPQAYLTYLPSLIPRLTVNIGKMYSNFGYETPRAKENWNYTHSYAWNFAIPIWNEGINVAYTFVPEKFSAGIYVFNGWDGRLSAEPNRSLTWGANLTWTPLKSLSVIYNGLVGPETGSPQDLRQLHELIAAYNVSAKLAFAFDAVYGSQANVASTRPTWWGASVYGRYGITESLDVVARAEHYDDSDGGFSVAGLLAQLPQASGQGSAPASTVAPKLNSYTLGLNWKMGSGLESRIEYRYDRADSAFTEFQDGTGAAQNSQSTLNIAALYSF